VSARYDKTRHRLHNFELNSPNRIFHKIRDLHTSCGNQSNGLAPAIRHWLCNSLKLFENCRRQGHTMSLETLIAAGVFGWLLIGMVMMGLGIW
jgi:hypothetical protein